MIPAARNAAGVVYVTTAAVGPTSTLLGGLARTALGQLHIVAAAPIVFPNAFGAKADGVLCHAPGGAIASWEQGFPFTSDGRLVTQLNATPLVTDPFIGGVRVGQLGGVYITDAVPVAGEAFDAGFDGGFA